MRTEGLWRLMFSPWAPTEWVQGRSRLPWFAGYFLVLFLGLYLGELVSNVLFPIHVGTPMFVFFESVGVLFALAAPASMLYTLLAPCPAKIGISPLGLELSYGARSKLYRWEDVMIHEREAVCFGNWLGVPSRVSLTDRQVQRLNSFLLSSATSRRPL